MRPRISATLPQPLVKTIPGHKKARGQKPSGLERCGVEATRACTESVPTNALCSPSPIRTIPSAPESHRIVRLCMTCACGLYRRSGLDRHYSTISPNPEGLCACMVRRLRKNGNRRAFRPAGSTFWLSTTANRYNYNKEPEDQNNSEQATEHYEQGREAPLSLWRSTNSRLYGACLAPVHNICNKTGQPEDHVENKGDYGRRYK